MMHNIIIIETDTIKCDTIAIIIQFHTQLSFSLVGNSSAAAGKSYSRWRDTSSGTSSGCTHRIMLLW